MFSDVQFMSADEKMRVLKAWKRFLKGGCKFSQFTKALYNHLIQHCSFIAHYNRAGFYSTYFCDNEGDNTTEATKFFSQFDRRGPCLSVENGNNGWLFGEYADINEAMIDAYTEHREGNRQEALFA